MSERSEPPASPAGPLAHGGRMDSATEAFVAGLYVVRNPEKLPRVERETPVSR